MAETERDALFQVLDALEALEIPYMVVGSFASTFWGRPCMTHDADLVVEIASAKVAELARLLAPYFYAPLFVIEEAVRKHGDSSTPSTWITLSRLTCGCGKDRPTMPHLLSGACWASCSIARPGSAARRM